MHPTAIFNIFSSFKQKFSNKSPHEKFLLVKSVNAFLLQFIGVDVMQDDFKIRFETWIPAYLCVNYFSLMFYSIYYYWDDPFRAIQSTPNSGQVIPVRFHNQHVT